MKEGEGELHSKNCRDRFKNSLRVFKLRYAFDDANFAEDKRRKQCLKLVLLHQDGREREKNSPRRKRRESFGRSFQRLAKNLEKLL